ncbi:hypothetical protein EYF80_014375 [Liparis tanakae]|uniref:Uncharacterized protein n=1 Tax=Liparis tanakae TaxID=230148 RepID=A0A4Z2IBE2_9TELE|nr:hypothetical protein EYF80_014375 [Liparis tanakae]
MKDFFCGGYESSTFFSATMGMGMEVSEPSLEKNSTRPGTVCAHVLETHRGTNGSGQNTCKWDENGHWVERIPSHITRLGVESLKILFRNHFSRHIQTDINKITHSD